ncbi:MAG: M20/M25/M40 family metallo-hydrolase [Halioglobus sp.]
MMKLPKRLGLALLFVIPAALGSTPAENLAEAVRFKTISFQDRSQIDYEQFGALNAFLIETYPRVFSELQVESVSGYSWLIRWPGTDESLSPVLFTAHTDVVPVEPGTEADWSYPAFAGVVADGRVYGRGTLDDKQGVISLLEAAEQLLAEGYQPAREIVFAFGHDEEISGLQGAGVIAQRMETLGLQFDWMVDEGGLVLSDSPVLPGKSLAMINVAEKGYLTLTLTAQGTGGHSSSPPRVSTIGSLSNALAKIEANPFAPKLEEPVRSFLETLAPHVEQPNQFLFSNLWLTDWLVASQMAKETLTQPMVRTTTALTMFNAGVKENVIPQRAEAKVNFRLLPNDTPEDVIEAIEAIIDDPSITVSHDRWNQRPGIADMQGSGFEVISEAVHSVYPDAVVVPSLLQATTDTRHYVGLARNQYRFHGTEMKPEQTGSIHGTDEYISIASLNNTVAVAVEMLRLGGAR